MDMSSIRGKYNHLNLLDIIYARASLTFANLKMEK